VIQTAPLLSNKYSMQESNENKKPLEDDDPMDEIPVVDLGKWIELHPKPSTEDDEKE